ncbi:hypothetical protein BJ165DRAFT_1524138 [Panaeolus papilionaceus]|nr:hypothetical protein BJ165DRAFT_1524138 [Panaeolus papilionaceus]
MRFASISIIALFSSLSFIWCAYAAPTTGGDDHARHPAKITWIKKSPASLTVTDPEGKNWFSDNAAELIKEGFKVNNQITFLKKAFASQTAHDVQLLDSPADVTYIDTGKKLVTLTDHRGKAWFVESSVAATLIAGKIKKGDHVYFQRDPAGEQSQTAFKVRKA